MKKISLFILVLLLFASFQSICQTNTDVEMADLLRKDGKIYTVVVALVVILTGMILFLIRVDRKIFRIEKEIQKKE